MLQINSRNKKGLYLVLAIAACLLMAYFMAVKSSETVAVSDTKPTETQKAYITGKHADIASGPMIDASNAILKNDKYQKTLPAKWEPKVQPRKDMPYGKVILQTLKWLFIAFAVMGIAGLIWLVITSYLDNNSTAKPPSTNKQQKSTTPPPAPVPAYENVSMAKVEELASSNDFGGAIHLLLLLCIAHLVRTKTITIGPATTGREVMKKYSFSNPQKTESIASLNTLIVKVEDFMFAGKEMTRDDYQRCLGHYHAFVNQSRQEMKYA